MNILIEILVGAAKIGLGLFICLGLMILANTWREMTLESIRKWVRNEAWLVVKQEERRDK